MLSGRILTTAVLLLTTAAAPIANAQSRTGFAVHAGLGASVIRDEDGDETFRGDDFGYLIGVEYRFTPGFALGLDVFDLGRADDTINSVDTRIEAAGIDLVGRLILPVSDSAELYGLVGVASYWTDVDPDGFPNLFGDDARVFGAGAEFGVGEQLAFRVEGRYFRGARDESGGLVTAGFSYRF